MTTPPASPSPRGIATTEFWVHTALQALTVCEGVLGTVSPGVALWVSAALGMVYIVARATVKFGDSLNGIVLDSTDNAGVPDSAEAPAVVGKITSGLLIVVCLGMLGVMTGCPQSETNRAATSMITIQTQASNAADLVNSGTLTEAQARTVQRLVHTERDAVKAYYAAIESGDSAALATTKAALAAAAEALATELAKYKLPAVTPIVIPNLPAPPAQTTTQPN